MKDLTPLYLEEKKAIYPNEKFPPSYSYQGHHCMALSAFSFDSNAKKPKKPKDKNKALNHFLKKVGFFPNREKNSIGLPTKKRNGDFKAFWEALDAHKIGNKNAKPLQLHGPGHDKKYFMKCEMLIRTLIEAFTDADDCEKISHQEMEDDLKLLIEQAENYAFIQLCALDDSGWDLHSSERKLAEKIYKGPPTKPFESGGLKVYIEMKWGKGTLNF